MKRGRERLRRERRRRPRRRRSCASSTLSQRGELYDTLSLAACALDPAAASWTARAIAILEDVQVFLTHVGASIGRPRHVAGRRIDAGYRRRRRGGVRGPAPTSRDDGVIRTAFVVKARWSEHGPATPERLPDVFVRDRTAERERLVSPRLTGAAGSAAPAAKVSISGDSRFVAFGAWQPRPGDTNVCIAAMRSCRDVFVCFDRGTGAIRRVSVGERPASRRQLALPGDSNT